MTKGASLATKIVIHVYDERTHAIHPYDDSTDRRFVFGNFLPSIQPEQRDIYGTALKRLLRSPDTTAIVLTPATARDELMGFSVATPDALVFVYVAYAYRRGRVGFHYGSELARVATRNQDRSLHGEMHGLHLMASKPIPCALWTRAASRMAGKGFPWYFDLDQNEKLKELGRR
jgi:hypothetical protein